MSSRAKDGRTRHEPILAVRAARLRRGANHGDHGPGRARRGPGCHRCDHRGADSTGAFVFAGGLLPPSSAITVDNTGESLSTFNGPFVEASEYLGGFWVIDVADEEAAVGWAARASKALGGRIEVRAFQVPPGE